ncbi:hypothetical protein EGW08_023115, partial [Elysia chlorotica]
MGNKPPSSSKLKEQEGDQTAATGVENKGKIPNTEAQADSVTVKVYLFGEAQTSVTVNFGLVNTIREEIGHLVEKNSLNVPPDECQLIMFEKGGNPTIMAADKEVEDYKDRLTPNSTIVKLERINMFCSVFSFASDSMILMKPEK